MLAVALLLLTAGAQLPARELGPALPTLAELGEGALDNDVFQPVATAAQDHLARGDEALAALKLRSTAPADERTWIEVLEHWSAALGACAPGDAVVPRPWRAAQGLDSPWPDPDGTAGGGASDRPARRTEAIEYAVLRRLASLAPAQRELWNARVGALAAEALVG